MVNFVNYQYNADNFKITQFGNQIFSANFSVYQSHKEILSSIALEAGLNGGFLDNNLHLGGDKNSFLKFVQKIEEANLMDATETQKLSDQFRSRDELRELTQAQYRAGRLRGRDGSAAHR